MLPQAGGTGASLRGLRYLKRLTPAGSHRYGSDGLDAAVEHRKINLVAGYFEALRIATKEIRASSIFFPRGRMYN